MSVIYAKTEPGNFPASMSIMSAHDKGPNFTVNVRSASTMKTSHIDMDRAELIEMATAVLMEFGVLKGPEIQ